MDQGRGKEPAHAADVAQQARHQVAGLLVVEKGLGQAQGAVEQGLLDLEQHLLLEAGEVELLQDAER